MPTCESTTHPRYLSEHPPSRACLRVHPYFYLPFHTSVQEFPVESRRSVTYLECFLLPAPFLTCLFSRSSLCWGSCVPASAAIQYLLVLKYRQEFHRTNPTTQLTLTAKKYNFIFHFGFLLHILDFQFPIYFQ